jgi:hypothetical protein
MGPDWSRPREALWHRNVAGADEVASVLQVLGFRGDVIVFRLNAASEARSGSESTFRRNTADAVAHSGRLITRRSQVQILPPLLERALETGSFRLRAGGAPAVLEAFLQAPGRRLVI